MRAFNAIVALASFIACASALPSFGLSPRRECLTKQSAHQLVKEFISLSNGGSFNTSLARELLTEDVVDTSGSVASIINGGTYTAMLSPPTEVQC